MQHSDELAAVRRWLRYAAEDLAQAEAILGQRQFVPRHACFLAQQAAEKALKAVLVYLSAEVPRIHNLNALRNLIPPDWEYVRGHADLTELTAWAIDARYPDGDGGASSSEATDAVRQARDVWVSVCRDLTAHGLPVNIRLDS